MKVRQDAWSHEDDLLLAETVLRHIREGSTQLNAFEEVGDALNRTSAACGFRWNAVVRDKYDDAIKLAKKHRKQKKRQMAQDSKPQVQKGFDQDMEPSYSFVEEFNKHQSQEFSQEFELPQRAELPLPRTKSVQSKPERELSLDEVIVFLRSMKGSGSKATLLEQENTDLKNKVNTLEQAYSQLKQQHLAIQEDYQSIIQIMDRARRMAVLEEESVDRSAAAFRMDKNGNLEKVAK
ncbi:RsfA family transcriptional regulator [Salipaludibacillus sp. CF4.18]|uniref:RsfA family transcriptional regulator n=1 Tax=Salipaludibacillus sp. CF4.18 TaxID=3373081 RepID=UPI003EE7AA2D